MQVFSRGAYIPIWSAKIKTQLNLAAIMILEDAGMVIQVKANG